MKLTFLMIKLLKKLRKYNQRLRSKIKNQFQYHQQIKQKEKAINLQR